MKNYLIVLSILGLTAATFGFIMPFMISVASTELVLAGIAYFFLIYIPVMYHLVSKFVPFFKKVIQNENS